MHGPVVFLPNKGREKKRSKENTQTFLVHRLLIFAGLFFGNKAIIFFTGFYLLMTLKTAEGVQWQWKKNVSCEIHVKHWRVINSTIAVKVFSFFIFSCIFRFIIKTNKLFISTLNHENQH